MKVRSAVRRLTSILMAFSTLAAVAPKPAAAQFKVALYGIHMDPSSQDAKDFSATAYGGGLRAVFPARVLARLFAATVGMEVVDFLDETHTFYDPTTLLRVEQQTSQNYFRFYVGPEFGPHGNGFLRPHVGVDLAAVYYGISTDIVVPDDVSRENEIRQNLRSRHEGAFGYDFNAGADLNVGRYMVEGGARLVKSFNLPQQLGDGAITIHPAYLQIYLGIGMNLSPTDR